MSVLNGIPLLFLPYKTYGAGVFRFRPHPKNRGITVNESRNKYVILECHTKQVPAVVKNPGAFFVNTQDTINSARERDWQKSLLSCTHALNYS